MRKVISIILLTIFIINLEGSYILFRYQQLAVQKEIKAQIRLNLPDKSLTVIVIPLSGLPGLQWIRENKEFTYQGKLFDVVRTSVSENQTRFYCINDKKESQLIKDYTKKRDQTEKSKKPLQKIPNTIYLFSGFQLDIPQGLEQQLFFTQNKEYTSRISDLLSPPPKIPALV